MKTTIEWVILMVAAVTYPPLRWTGKLVGFIAAPLKHGYREGSVAVATLRTTTFYQDVTDEAIKIAQQQKETGDAN